LSEPNLHEDHSRLLGVLTITAAERLGGETFVIEEDNGVRELRMRAWATSCCSTIRPTLKSRAASIAIWLRCRTSPQRHPAARMQRGSRSTRSAFCISLRWMYNATPPDLHLQLVKDPGLWFDFVGNTLLGALSEHDPDLRERLAAANAA